MNKRMNKSSTADRRSFRVVALPGDGVGVEVCSVAEQAELGRGERRRLVSQPHWGHSPHWESPVEAASAIAQFLEIDAGLPVERVEDQPDTTRDAAEEAPC